MPHPTSDSLALCSPRSPDPLFSASLVLGFQCVPGSVLGAGDPLVNKCTKPLSFKGCLEKQRDRQNKYWGG